MLAASYAKINLYLEVLRKREDNYHEVNTVLCSIDLCDYIKYALTKKPSIKLWTNRAELDSRNNLIFRIAEYLQQQYSPQLGVEIVLEKNIPIAAGLGGGSSNAAVTLLALNKLWNLNLTDGELNEIAGQFGSDINFFLIGGTARGTGRGEIVEPMDDLIVDNILLVNPGIHISAAEAYRLIEPNYTATTWHPGMGLTNSLNRLEAGIKNQFEEVRLILDKMRIYNPVSAMMSGSGSTCFAIFDDQTSLNEAAEYFGKQGFWTYKARTISKEEYLKCFQN